MTGEIVCSAQGRKEHATWVITWRNPRIHDATRKKQWVACDGHRQHLEAFLTARSFPVEVGPLETV